MRCRSIRLNQESVLVHMTSEEIRKFINMDAILHYVKSWVVLLDSSLYRIYPRLYGVTENSYLVDARRHDGNTGLQKLYSVISYFQVKYC